MVSPPVPLFFMRDEEVLRRFVFLFAVFVLRFAVFLFFAVVFFLADFVFLLFFTAIIPPRGFSIQSLKSQFFSN